MRRLAFILIVLPALAQVKPKFYEDDPVWRSPEPMTLKTARARKLSDYYDYFLNTFSTPGELRGKQTLVPARNVNTLGEVPDSEWYTNRHYLKPMTTEEIVRGPEGQPPSLTGKWTITAAKSEGVTPGFTIVDSAQRRYVLKFDPMGHRELATAADVISSKFFHALGYNVPANFIVGFKRDQLVIGDETMLTDRLGKRRRMTGKDLADILHNAPVDNDGMYRAVASYYLTGTPVGPFRYHGTRKDDPNDTVPHEHRRELRGLRLICAWLGHDDSRSINTLDLLVEQGGRQFVRHYLIDFGSTLGSASYGPNSPRSGNEYVFSWKAPAAEFFTLGLYAPRWTRAHFPDFPSVGRFESAVFDPVKWVPEYKNPAFLNETPDDAFWAARQIVSFTDEHIRAVVASGRYSDPAAAEWVTKCLIERRDKIGRAYLAKALAVDQFSVEKGALQFRDIAAVQKIAAPREYSISWSEFDNATRSTKALAGARGPQLPRVDAEYVRATIRGGDDRRAVDVYIRNPAGQAEVVGVERHW